MTSRPLHSLGFIHLAPFWRGTAAGHAEALDLFRLGDQLGLDGAWIRTRHLQHGLSSPTAFLGAASQVTERIALGTAVIPAGFENPFRLAEDLATVDVLSGGRVHAGLSVHGPSYPDEKTNDRVYDTGWRQENYGYGRLERLRSFIQGEKLREKPPYRGIGGDLDSETTQPQSPGLADRLWYGGGSLKSATWAGKSGWNWLVSNISSTPDGTIDFAKHQREQIDTFRAHSPAGDRARATVARVLIPTDGASPSQVRRYREYAEGRRERTEHVHGTNTIIAKDVLGSTDEIAEFIVNDPAFQAADDYLFELPFELELEDWHHILEQLATRIGPALGWQPGTSS